jgi:hypothetical protein
MALVAFLSPTIFPLPVDFLPVDFLSSIVFSPSTVPLTSAGFVGVLSFVDSAFGLPRRDSVPVGPSASDPSIP